MEEFNDRAIMYLLYADESGDPGVAKTLTPYFVLSGIVVHEYDWSRFVETMFAFRRRMKRHFGFGMRDEIHAAEFARGYFPSTGIARNNRIAVLRHLSDELGRLPYLTALTVVVEKGGKPHDFDVFGVAWHALLRRFNEGLQRGDFSRGRENRYGIVFCDDTNGKRLTSIIREFNAADPTPREDETRGDRSTVRLLIEDPNQRNSKASYFIQAADVVAYLTYQKYNPNKNFKKFGGHNFHKKFAPIIPTEPHAHTGIIEI